MTKVATTRGPAGRTEAPALDNASGAVSTRGTSYSKTLPEPGLVQVVDFFAGCGGMSYGFAHTRQSGLAFDVLAGIDVDERALETYRLNNNGLGVCRDIRDIAENPELLSELVPSFDPSNGPFVFIGCPPCQGFSAHRKKDHRDDPRNNLVEAFAVVCAHWLPDVVVMENVPEMLAGRFEHYYAEAKRVLERSGYRLAEDVLDLSLYGVPQRRRRSIVVAARERQPSLPPPALEKDEVRSVRDAIGHLAPLAAGGSDDFDPWHRSPSHTPRIIELIQRIPHDGGDRRSLPEEHQLDCHKNLDRGSTPGFSDVYGRLRWDAPAVTITAKSSTPSCGRFLHPEQDRNISVREAALLQGFPHRFVFTGPFVNQYRQIGEAVPPLFAQHLAFQVLDTLSPPSPLWSSVRARLDASGPNGSREDSNEDSGIVSVDLFCGAGGLSLGLQAAGLKHGLGVDLDEAATSTYRQNVSAEVLCESVTSERVREELDRLCRLGPLVVAGGPPCQGFSQQRRGVDQDERNDLVREYGELVTSLPVLPTGVVLENVMYLDSPRGREAYAAFVTALEDAGYVVHRHDLNSAEYGVPQLRKRIVLVGLLPAVSEQYSGPVPLSGARYPTLGETLGGLTTCPTGGVANHVAAREQPVSKRRIAYVDMGRGRTAIPEELQLACHRGYDGHLDVFGRLDWFSQARTITGGFDSASRGEYAHPFRNRSITAREAARIQGFPDWFGFSGTRSDVRKQIGNAVPPPMGFAIGLAVRQAIEKEQNG